MKVDILLFSYRQAPTTALGAITAMYNAARAGGLDVHIRVHGNALIHRSRNTALGQIREDADFALFLDDDMVPRSDSLLRLVAHNVPAVSALCTTRTPPIEIAAKVYHPASDQFCPLETVNLARLVTGQFGVGAAFLLLRRDAIDNLREYFLSARDWLEENRRRLDRMHVRADQREAERKHLETLRRANWERERVLRVFDYTVIENELQLGEDISFSRKLIKLGIPVSIDGTLQPAHIGEYGYSVMDVVEQENEALVA